MRKLTRITPPVAEPVTLAEAKAHLRVDLNDDDALIAAMIGAAREWVEERTGRALIAQSWLLTLDEWPEGLTLTLARPPVQAVTAVRTINAQGAPNTWDSLSYALSAGADWPNLLRLTPAWPTPGRAEAGIEIDLTCGYGASGASVPGPLRQGILRVVAHLYEMRGGAANDDNALGAMALIAPYKVVTL
jgi:uncharacterized phiE125 gp8 family phage protein